jgi:hypothetical protein
MSPTMAPCSPKNPMKAATTPAQRPRRENAQSVEFAQVNKVSATIERSCALRAQWRCRACGRRFVGEALHVLAGRRAMPLRSLSPPLATALEMDHLACPTCGSPAIAMK